MQSSSLQKNFGANARMLYTPTFELEKGEIDFAMKHRLLLLF